MRLAVIGMLCVASAAALAQDAARRSPVTTASPGAKPPRAGIILVGPAAYSGRPPARKLTAAVPFADGEVPLPRPRPPEAGKGAPEAPPAATETDAPAKAEAPAAPPPPSACFVALSTGFGVVTQLPPINLPNGCEAPDVVQLEAVVVSPSRRITIDPPAVLRCPMATEIVNWVREDLVPLTDAAKLDLTGIENYDSFECRGRNRVVGAKTSEHGRANALDVRALLLAGRKRVTLTDPEADHALRDRLKADVCSRFSTVLGPGSDGYHEEHVHLDLIERRNNYKICQWDVRDPTIPLPPERPAEAPPREQASQQPPPARAQEQAK